MQAVCQDRVRMAGNKVSEGEGRTTGPSWTSLLRICRAVLRVEHLQVKKQAERSQ